MPTKGPPVILLEFRLI